MNVLSFISLNKSTQEYKFPEGDKSYRLEDWSVQCNDQDDGFHQDKLIHQENEFY